MIIRRLLVAIARRRMSRRPGSIYNPIVVVLNDAEIGVTTSDNGGEW